MNKTDFFLNLIASLRMVGIRDIADTAYPIELGVEEALKKARDLKIPLDFNNVKGGYLTRAGLQTCLNYGIICSKISGCQYRIEIKLASSAAAINYMKHRDKKIDIENWKIVAGAFLEVFENAAFEEESYRERLRNG